MLVDFILKFSIFFIAIIQRFYSKPHLKRHNTHNTIFGTHKFEIIVNINFLWIQTLLSLMKTQGWALWYWYLYSVAHGPMLARLTSQTLSFCGGILYPHFCWLLPLSGNNVLFLYTETISKNLVYNLCTT